MSNKKQKYCENRECEHNVLFSCNLYDDVPSYYASTGEFGDVQYGAGNDHNYLKNAVQAEGTVPVQPYRKKDGAQKNKHKN